ncbi:MAG: NAD(P)H-dependent oxidoreductase subunit E [Candidatus Eisenbacteria bacterium]|nr:NAD(P)H-dependent oxidoreductase subunit E [Candidatus Eisenbacteria bacterium]
MKAEDIQAILDKRKKEGGGLIAILEDVQAKYGCLPQEALKIVSKSTGRSMVDVFAVATFYRSFSLKPRGRHLVSVCVGTACHVRRSALIVQEFEKQLAIARGQTTSDREFTLETVNCLGACAIGPIVVVDGHYFSQVNVGHVSRILKKVRDGLDKVEVKGDERIFPVEVSCPRCNHTFMDRTHLIDGKPSIRVTIAFGNQHGWLRLSSLYGSYNVESEYEVPPQAIVNFFCPHCHTELIGGWDCPECGAPTVPMIVRNGGIVQICSRKGCRYHMLDLTRHA